MDDKWYVEIDASENISQGDIFLGFPLLTPDPEFNYSLLENIEPKTLEEKVPFVAYTADIIIMSQACDLVLDPSRNRFPIDPVIVAPIDHIGNYSWALVSETNSGSRPAYYLLHKKENGIRRMEHQIIDFSSIFTVPYKLLDRYRQTYGARIRPVSPVLEKVSHHFGNYFSRIGLEGEIAKKDLKEDHERLK